MDDIKYLSTELLIDEVCYDCPLKLYNKKGSKVTYGVGNIYANTILILPPYNINSKKDSVINIIDDLYSKNTGKNIFEEYYITRTIKCYNSTNFNLNDSAFKICYKYLIHEICRIKPKSIILFDKNYYEFIDNFCSNYKIQVHNILNPNVMWYDNNIIKESFMQQFKDVVI